VVKSDARYPYGFGYRTTADGRRVDGGEGCFYCLVCWQTGGEGSVPLRIDKSALLHLQLHRQARKRTPACHPKVAFSISDFQHMWCGHLQRG